MPVTRLAPIQRQRQTASLAQKLNAGSQNFNKKAPSTQNSQRNRVTGELLAATVSNPRRYTYG